MYTIFTLFHCNFQQEPKEKAEQALQAATEFAQIFYEYLDKKRNVSIVTNAKFLAIKIKMSN